MTHHVWQSVFTRWRTATTITAFSYTIDEQSAKVAELVDSTDDGDTMLESDFPAFDVGSYKDVDVGRGSDEMYSRGVVGFVVALCLTSRGPLEINMYPENESLVQILFLSKQVIFRFHVHFPGCLICVQQIFQYIVHNVYIRFLCMNHGSKKAIFRLR